MKYETDTEILERIEAEFGHGWFTARQVKLLRARIEELRTKGYVEVSKAVNCSTLNYRLVKW